MLTTMRDWGIGYFRLDFLYASACEGHRHSTADGVDAYHRALHLIRRVTRRLLVPSPTSPLT
jgi:alpha-galactosidase